MENAKREGSEKVGLSDGSHDYREGEMANV